MFSNAEVISQLNEHFVNVAVDINYLQNQQDNEGRLFRKIAEQGHYGGRTKPTPTRQGLYVATTDGQLLASINTTSARQTLAMIDRANKRLNETDRASVKMFAEGNSPDEKYAIAFPVDGMILRQTMRDLPRAETPGFETWRHNFDHVWLTAEEINSFVPANPSVGEKYSIPEPVIRRLARFHFVDQVKGEADAFGRSTVSKANLEAEVIEVQNGKAKIQLRGTAKCIQPPSGEINPFSGNKIDKERGVDLAIRGWLDYDTTNKAFEKFDLIATGPRWGAATYNFRSRDMGPAPIGFAFELLPTKPENMTRPKFLLWDYFDRR